MFDCGLDVDMVGRCNPKEIDALLKRKKQADNRVQFNFGIVAASVYNAAPFGDSKREAVSPLEFVPDWNKKKKKETDMTKMTPEQQKDYLFSVFGKMVVKR